MRISSIKLLLTSLFLLVITFLSAQQKVDGTINFQNDPAKKYSLYIPSNYDENSPNKLMLGLHPFNTSRWNSASWRDKLSDMAEMNNLIVLCPDGGKDGKIDDPIDTAFTSALLDSVKLWYNINDKKIFAMGFSWGGRTTYTYGLRRAHIFAGFIPIGAAINGTGLFNDVLKNAKNKPFYIIHGDRDTPNSRFYPAKDALIQNNAIVGDSLLAGVGHTVDFQGSTNMFDIAFDFVDQQDDIITSNDPIVKEENELLVYPNPIREGEKFTISNDSNEEVKINITNIEGRLILSTSFKNELVIDTLQAGTYFIEQISPRNNKLLQFIILSN